MKEFPKEWCTDVCPEVIEFINKKYNTNYKGDQQFYGTLGSDEWCNNISFGTYISHEEFMELSGLGSKEQIMKVGDMVWVNDNSDEDARKNKEERELLAILPEDITMKYIVRGKDLANSTEKWVFAVPVVKEEKKERKLMLTDQEWEKLEKIYK